MPFSVIPAKAGIQLIQDVLDPGVRRGDGQRDFLRTQQKVILIISFFFFLTGCSTNSNFSTIPDDARINIGKTNISGVAPLTGDISRTTFGKYPVMVEKDGHETLYAILPMNE